MARYTRESLENLRHRIDLLDVLSMHLDLKRAGAFYRTHCPFHDEKTPSFSIQKGASHYHCFGCGAHGDAIQFLMNYAQMSFSEAVENLAQRFQVPLEEVEGRSRDGASLGQLKAALNEAAQFYHFMLLHSEEGQEALDYLFRRGLDLSFIRRFGLGYAPEYPLALKTILNEAKFSNGLLKEAGLLSERGGKLKDFFNERILFPIRNAAGSVIGFSGRKLKESTFGGKYVNSPETPLFKKSRLLFGLNYCRRRIAKERCAIIVEGQVDALRLIHAGFDLTVAGQGTAFGEGQMEELHRLGVRELYLALDGDGAGREAALKIGDMAQRKGVEAWYVPLPEGSDPDTLLNAWGPQSFQWVLDRKKPYLNLLFESLKKDLDLRSPGGKSAFVKGVRAKIQHWEDPVMIHESLKSLAKMAGIPEQVLGIQAGQMRSPIRRGGRVGNQEVDADQVLEGDLLRWLLLQESQDEGLMPFLQRALSTESFHSPLCRAIFDAALQLWESKGEVDLLSLSMELGDEAAEDFMGKLLEKRVNPGKAREQIVATVQKILDRNWMKRREEIKFRLQSGSSSDEEALDLAAQFEQLCREKPLALWEES